MRFKPLKEKDGKLPKITEKMPKTAVKIVLSAFGGMVSDLISAYKFAFMDLSKVLPMPFEDYEPDEEAREFMKEMTSRLFIDRRRFYV